MTAPLARCSACGSAVPDEALETGAAILLLGKAYCPSCKLAAVRNVSLDDLSTPHPSASTSPAAAPKPPPAKPADAPPPPERPRPPARPLPPRIPRRPSRSKLPLVFAGAAVVLAAVLFAAFRGDSPSPPPAPPGASPRPPEKTTPLPDPADPEGRAKAAFAKIQPLLNRGDVDPAEILSAIDAAGPACRGTSFAAKLDEARAKIVADRDKLEASRKLDPLLDALKKGVAEDLEFRRYDELQARFQEARGFAALASPSAISTLQLLQQDYSGRYEKAAEPFYADIHEAAEALAREGRYDDALRHIDSFPKQFRKSGVWRSLDRLREQVERDKKTSPKK